MIISYQFITLTLCNDWNTLPRTADCWLVSMVEWYLLRTERETWYKLLFSYLNPISTWWCFHKLHVAATQTNRTRMTKNEFRCSFSSASSATKHLSHDFLRFDLLEMLCLIVYFEFMNFVAELRLTFVIVDHTPLSLGWTMNAHVRYDLAEAKLHIECW